MTGLYYRSMPGDYIGAGETHDARAPELAIEIQRPGVDAIEFYMNEGDQQYRLSLAAPLGAPLAASAYEEAARYPFRRASPGLELGITGRGCNQISGRFVVLQADYGPGGTVNSFAADFEQWCDGNAAPLYGEFRYNSTIPFSFLETGAATALPDPFALEAQSPVRAGAVVRSNSITVYGVSVPVPISINGGEYSINGAPYVSQSGMANPLDHIVVRMIASSTPGETAQATLNVGGQTSTLSVQTYQPGTVLTGLFYRSTSGDYIGQGETHLYMTPRNKLEANTYANTLSWTLTATGGIQMNLMITGPGNDLPGPGTYEGAVRSPLPGSGMPGIDFFGEGRGCSSIAGRFVIHEAVYGAGGVVEHFAADFEQSCEGTGPPLFGEIRFNSTVPFSTLVELPGDVPRMGNISTRAQVLTGNDVLIGGFVIDGTVSKKVAVVATGPSLTAYGVPNALANPTLTLVRSSDQTIVATNDDWQSDANASQLQAAGFAPSNSLEPGILASLPPGGYTAIVSGVGNTTGVGLVAVYEVDHPEVPLINISTRGQVLTGSDVMIGGFVIQGARPQTVAIVATGPSLANYGIANPLPNPYLSLVRSSDQTTIATNDNWQSDSNAAQLQAAGFAPANPLESALLVTLPPGAYTAIVSGIGGGTGVGVVAVYSVD